MPWPIHLKFRSPLVQSVSNSSPKSPLCISKSLNVAHRKPTPCVWNQSHRFPVCGSYSRFPFEELQILSVCFRRPPDSQSRSPAPIFHPFRLCPLIVTLSSLNPSEWSSSEWKWESSITALPWGLCRSSLVNNRAILRDLSKAQAMVSGQYDAPYSLQLVVASHGGQWLFYFATIRWTFRYLSIRLSLPMVRLHKRSQNTCGVESDRFHRFEEWSESMRHG